MEVRGQDDRVVPSPTAEGVDTLAATATRDHGRVDILINNAGAGSKNTIVEAPDEKWQEYWDLHVMAAVRLAWAIVPGMRRHGGGVILHNASTRSSWVMDGLHIRLVIGSSAAWPAT